MAMQDQSRSHKSGYVALIGAPNVGKSTLMNQILKEKISITAPKPQTTRNRILGILSRSDSQIIFVDTPGIHQARDRFNKILVSTALAVLHDVDVICFLIEPAKMERSIDQMIMQELAAIEKPLLLVINKVDTVRDKSELLPLIDRWRKSLDFHAVFPISALLGDGVEGLLSEIIDLLPEGPPLFPEEYSTDVPERFLVAELIREKIFHLAHQEVPYAVAVTVDRFSENSERKRIDIDATIHVERDSQKGIIIGKKGRMLKQVGVQARKDIEALLGCHVFLNLFVRVQKNWRKNPRALADFGFRGG